MDDGGRHFRRRHEVARIDLEGDARLRAPTGEHAEAAIGVILGRGDDALGHLLLEHQRRRRPPRRPGIGAQPADEQRSRDVVRQVGDDTRRTAADAGGEVLGQGISLDDLQLARIGVGDLGERRQAAPVALDCDDALGAAGEQGAGQAAGTGADLDHGDAFQRSAGAGDAGGQIEVQEEVLAERLDGAETMLGDDVAQRRQIVDLSHQRHPVGRAPAGRGGGEGRGAWTVRAGRDGGDVPPPVTCSR